MGVKGALSAVDATLTQQIIAFNVIIVNTIIKHMIKLSKNSSAYPKQLASLSDAPNNLFFSSQVDTTQLLFRPKVAVVGSRKVSAYGRLVTEQMVKALVAKGVVIISGLALGVDSIAHSETLKNGGQTIAVLPCGLNNIYPSSHKSLSEHILKQGGALVSEYQPDEKIAFKGNFIARNRIIAGLADIVLITEAAKGSGSLHTASFALDMGIDVFAVPGPITSPTSEGCNNLIKAGSGIVTSPNDLYSALGLSNKQAKQTQLPLLEDKNQTTIIKLIASSDQAISVDQLQERSNLEITEINKILSMLEILGHIKPVGNNRWAL